MKKVLLGLVIAVMMTGTGYTEEKSVEKIINDIEQKAEDILLITGTAEDEWSYGFNDEEMCKIAKIYLGWNLYNYAKYKFIVTELYIMKDKELETSKIENREVDPKRQEKYEKEMENTERFYNLQDSNRIETLGVVDSYLAICKD